jgi:transcriptional regulator with XRE-family HTH domain
MPIRRRISDPLGFARRVAELREKKGLTQAQLGRSAGVSGTCVWNWENGNTFPRVDTLKALARALGTTGTHLVEGDEHPSAYGSGVGAKSGPAADLPDLIRSARESIAAAAGISLDKVRVVLDYDA